MWRLKVVFFLSKGRRFEYKFGFNLIQSIIDLDLMEEIRNFFLNLPAKDKANYNYYKKVVNLNISKSKPNLKGTVLVYSHNTVYFKNVLIPFFDSLVLQTPPPPFTSRRCHTVACGTPSSFLCTTGRGGGRLYEVGSPLSPPLSHRGDKARTEPAGEPGQGLSTSFFLPLFFF